MKPRPTLLCYPSPKTKAELQRLAEANHRTAGGEVLIAIESHLVANRIALRKGPRMERRDT